MKLKYFVLITVIIVVAVYIYQDKKLQQILMGKMHQVAPELNKSTLYKWQNHKGEWQVSDIPPAKGIPFTTISSKDQVNVMPSLPVTSSEKK